MPHCVDCKFFEYAQQSLLLTGQRNGVCHRYPPQGYMMAGQYNGQLAAQIIFHHPEVNPQDYCGEWDKNDNVEE